MATNLKVGKISDALANLTTPQTPQTPQTTFAPWGVSPQAERLLLSITKNPLSKTPRGFLCYALSCITLHTRKT